MNTTNPEIARYDGSGQELELAYREAVFRTTRRIPGKVSLVLEDLTPGGA